MYRRLFFLFGFVACRDQQRTKAPSGPPQSPSTAPVSITANWRTFDGESFTLRYPPDATLATAESHPAGRPGTAIRGPVIHVPVSPDVGPSDGPAYQLVVSELPNPSNRSTEQWVDSVRKEENAQEMDQDSLGFLHAPDTLTVNGSRALRLEPFCGDCEPEEIYIAGPGHTVVISYVFDVSFPGDRDVQRRLYSTILNTFAWKR